MVLVESVLCSVDCSNCQWAASQHCDVRERLTLMILIESLVRLVLVPKLSWMSLLEQLDYGALV